MENTFLCRMYEISKPFIIANSVAMLHDWKLLETEHFLQNVIFLMWFYLFCIHIRYKNQIIFNELGR